MVPLLLTMHGIIVGFGWVGVHKVCLGLLNTTDLGDMVLGAAVDFLRVHGLLISCHAGCWKGVAKLILAVFQTVYTAGPGF